jgi:hypothetical protein
MKSKMCHVISLLVGIGMLAMQTPRAWAIAGVGDITFTTIVGDATAGAKWALELEQWTALINQATTYVDRADQMIKLAGDPKQLMGELAEIVGETGIITGPLDTALGIQTQAEALNLAVAVYGLKDAVNGTVQDVDAVATTYKVFGKEFKRDPKKYEKYAMQEALQGRCKQATENVDVVLKAEGAVHDRLMKKLAAAKTATERETINAALAASQQRVDLAKTKAKLCTNEYNLFLGKLNLTADRRVAADKEWAQQMLKEMQNRAVDALKAQQDPNATDNGFEDSPSDQGLAPTI